jgi:hypothetical protein
MDMDLHKNEDGHGHGPGPTETWTLTFTILGGESGRFHMFISSTTAINLPAGGVKSFLYCLAMADPQYFSIESLRFSAFVRKNIEGWFF